MFFNGFFTRRLEFKRITHFTDSKNSSTELYLIEGSFNDFFTCSKCSSLKENSSIGCQEIIRKYQKLRTIEKQIYPLLQKDSFCIVYGSYVREEQKKIVILIY